MSNVRGELIEDHPIDTLSKIKALLDLIGSVNWDDPMGEAGAGAQYLMIQIHVALEHVIEQLGDKKLAA